MNQNIKRLLLFCWFFTLIANLNPSVPMLITNLGTLKKSLSELSSSLQNLSTKKEPQDTSTFNQDALDIYALYGDDPAIIKGRTTVKKDSTKNPRLILPNGSLDMQVYTGYGYKTTNLKTLDDIIKEMSSTQAMTPEEKAKTTTTKTPYQKIKADLAGLFSKKPKSVTIAYEVPAFIGISSAKIKQYLDTKKLTIGTNKLTISQAWAQAISKIPEATRKQSLVDKNLPPQFVLEIKQIEQAIKNVFTTETSTNLDALFGMSKINKFLLDAKTQNLQLMVRSTGKEDTPELANAGGNETIGNVNPDPKTVLMAMGTGKQGAASEDKLGVVSSYFGIKSFTQRIKAGDPTIYEEPPTPVLIQVMIGEVTGGEIPSCGVMFTEEPEGGIARKGEKNKKTDQFITTGITKTEGSYGLNEGVVNSMVPVDVYYSARDKSFSSIIRKKDKRVIFDAKGIQIVKNQDTKTAKNLDIVTKPALSNAEVAALKTLSNYLEFYYKRPMDVEFVIKKKKSTDTVRTIYIVQARPIVNNDKVITPSYIFDLNKYPEKVSGEVVGTAGGALRLVNNIDECVITDTLKEALEVYDKLPKVNSDKVACIIVKEMAPATSHEATQFRTYQKAVICIPKVKETVTAWLTAGKTVLIDLQQETAVVWNNPNTIANIIQFLQSTADETFPGGALLKGLINYPIPMKLSLNDQKDTVTKDPATKKLFSKMTLSDIKIRFKAFTSSNTFSADDATQAKTAALAEFKAAITQSLTPPKPTAKVPVPKAPTIADKTPVPAIAVSKYLKNIKNYFGLLKTGDEKTSKINLLKICFGALSVIETILKNSPGDDDIAYQATLILNHLLIHANNASKTLSIPATNTSYYQRLYAVRFLEAVLFQNPSKDILNSYSLDALTKNIYLKEKKTGKKLGAVLGKLAKAPTPQVKQYLAQYAQASNYILTDALKETWFALLKQLTLIPELNQKTFNYLFGEIADNNLLTPWFLLSFDKITKSIDPAVSNPTNAIAIVTALNADYAKNKPLIEALKERREGSEGFNTLEISLWSNPSKFTKQLAQLTKIGAYFQSAPFFTAYKNSGDLGKVFAIQVMGEFIDLFDHSLKEFKPSTVGKTKDEMCTIVKNEKTLLTLFLTFVSLWLDKFEAKKTDASGTVTLEKLSLNIPHALSKYNAVSVKLTGIDDKKINPAELKMTANNEPALLVGTKDLIDDTKSFDVSISAIGGSGSSVLYLNTLEDIFTFTHQSLMYILGELNKQINIKPISALMGILDDEILNKMQAVPASFHTAKQVSLSSTSPQGNKTYTHPLGQHSMEHILSFDPATNKIRVTSTMKGVNEFSRFAKVIDYLDVTSEILGLKFSYQFPITPLPGFGDYVTWVWEVDDKTAQPSIERIKYLIVAAAGMSWANNNYVSSIGVERTIYNETFGTYLKLTEDEKKELALDSIEQAICNRIIERSFNKKASDKKAYDRLHSAFVTALEKLPKNLTASNKNNWLKTIEILGRLLDEKNPAYATNTECYYFKKYHSAAYAGGGHPVLITLFKNFITLSPANYVTTAKALPAKAGNAFFCKTEYDFFKFREAKKILNYLCQMSQYFDEECWTALLNVIKNNAPVIAGFKNLVLDPLEGNGPAAANLTAENTSVRVLPLETSMATLYANAAKFPSLTIQKLGSDTVKLVGVPLPPAPPAPAPPSALDSIKELLASDIGSAVKLLIAMGTTSKTSIQNAALINEIQAQMASGDIDTFLALMPLISGEFYTDPGLIKATGNALVGLVSSTGIADTIIPGQPAKRKKLTDFAAFMLNKKYITPDLIWAKQQAVGTQRAKLLCMLVLFEAPYSLPAFFSASIPYIFERLNDNPAATDYSQIALDCYNALKTNITAKKYVPADIAALKTTLTPITTKLDKKVELVTLIASKYP